MPPPSPPERHAGIRPFPSIGRAVDAVARHLFPFASTAVAVVVLAFPLGLPGQAELLFALLLCSVYFWSIYRPGSIGPSAVFALGLLADLLGPEPPGITALVLLLLSGTAVRFRLQLQRGGFLVVWLAFTGFAAAAIAAVWLATAALDLRLLPLAPALLTLGVAAGLYSPFAAALIRAHGGLAAPERA